MELKYDEKSCGTVLFRMDHGQRKYLLLRYPGGHWDLVKGHVETGEEEMSTAARELKEETGIKKFRFFDGFREQISYTYSFRRKPSNKEVIFFLAETPEYFVRMSDEHRGFKWLPYPDAIKKLTFDNARNLVHKAEKFLLKA